MGCSTLIETKKISEIESASPYRGTQLRGWLEKKSMEIFFAVKKNSTALYKNQKNWRWAGRDNSKLTYTPVIFDRRQARDTTPNLYTAIMWEGKKVFGN